MLFTNWKILLGIAIGWGLYYLPFVRQQQLLLLIAGSLAIYTYEAPTLVLLLLSSVLVNAYASYRVMRTDVASARTKWALVGVALNLLLLGFFKYNRLLYELVLSEVSPKGEVVHALLMLPLPIGISFYSFHGISLLVDTLRARMTNAQPAWARTDALADFRPHLKDTLLYLCFFPQLVAGPITKANFFYPQIKSKQFSDIDWNKVLDNLIVGYFLKLVVANNLANLTFNLQYPYFIGMVRNDLILLLFGYSMQIFADFAGYSLIAIGLAALFGYELPRNFNFPYISRSFSEFWTRWHISLSSWLKEYLYIPLGGNRKGASRTYVNLMIVMVLGGLWHGAAISYAVWGAWHGTALVLERLITRGEGAAPGGALPVLRALLVFVVVTLGWLLFKIPEFSHVLAYLREVWLANWHPGLSNISRAVLLLSMPVVLYHAAHELRVRQRLLEGLRQPALGMMAFLILLNAGPNSPFIYFQF